MFYHNSVESKYGWLFKGKLIHCLLVVFLGIMLLRFWSHMVLNIPWQFIYIVLSITVGSTFQMWLVCLPIQAYCTDEHIGPLKILRTSSLDYRKLFMWVVKKHLSWSKTYLGSQFLNFFSLSKTRKIQKTYYS